jgi:DNA-directed RNA polymerase specialized sigma24 family protein
VVRKDSHRNARQAADSTGVARTPRRALEAGAQTVCESTPESATLEAEQRAEPAPASEGAETPQPAARAKHAHWRQILSGASPREVLARLMAGDPLHIRGLVARKLGERAYLCDADRVFMRSIARVSRFAVRYRGQPEIDEWLSGAVDEALLDLLRDDLEAERAGAAADQADIAAFVDLARPLGLDPLAMRGVCNTFNHLPEAERRAFHALLIAGRSLDELASESGQSATDTARAARRALDTLLALPEDSKR